MTEPSQYFKGRTVQEQMNEVIGYVDARAEEVAAAKADDVLEPAEQAKDDAIQAKNDAQAAQAAAEQAVIDAAAVLANAVKKTGESSQGIAGDIIVAGNLTGGKVTVPTPVNNTDAANKKYVDDHDALKLNISDINTVAVGLTGNQGPIAGVKTFGSEVICAKSGLPHIVTAQTMSAAPPASNVSTTMISMQPIVNGVLDSHSANINVTFYPSGAVEIWANVMGADGNLHKVSLADGRNYS